MLLHLPIEDYHLYNVAREGNQTEVSFSISSLFEGDGEPYIQDVLQASRVCVTSSLVGAEAPGYHTYPVTNDTVTLPPRLPPSIQSTVSSTFSYSLILEVSEGAAYYPYTQGHMGFSDLAPTPAVLRIRMVRASRVSERDIGSIRGRYLKSFLDHPNLPPLHFYHVLP